MDREKFVKRKWQAYEEVELINNRKTDFRVRCMVLAIDFENDTMQIEPFDRAEYEDKSHWVSRELIEIPKFKLVK